MVIFEWDGAKAKASVRQHGIPVEEAQSVLYDEFAIQFFDQDHADDEARFLLLGMSTGARLLLVCHYARGAGDVIRIISARKATPRESAFYGSEAS
jgi:uncharacterized DUF497 family protein